jgi:hypothetical protein
MSKKIKLYVHHIFAIILVLAFGIFMLISGVSSFPKTRTFDSVQIESIQFSHLVDFEKKNIDVVINNYILIGEYATQTTRGRRSVIINKYHYILIIVEDATGKDYIMSLRIADNKRKNIVTYLEDSTQLINTLHFSGKLRTLTGEIKSYFHEAVSLFDPSNEVLYTLFYIDTIDTYSSDMFWGIASIIFGLGLSFITILSIRNFIKNVKNSSQEVKDTNNFNKDSYRGEGITNEYSGKGTQNGVNEDGVSWTYFARK